ncbi:MAG TPA: ribonuclease Z [Pyrinomonadaceae bacterium]|nr:ribonuclease Z [Pyrinomonadaceae bacterium]
MSCRKLTSSGKVQNSLRQERNIALLAERSVDPIATWTCYSTDAGQSLRYINLMKLVVLGSGTSLPHARRTSSAHWLETAAGSVLLDISADAPHRMAQEQLDWPNLDAIWLSHFHLDHMGGLTPFLFATRNAPQTQQRRKPLKIFGPQGFVNLLTAVNNSNNYRLLEQSFPIDLNEVDADAAFEILPGLSATVFSTPHTNESLAVRLKEKDGSVLVYTSDTGYSEELANFGRNATILLMECSFYRNKPVEKHLELQDAMRIAQESQPGKVVLSHLYMEWDGIDLAIEARKLWQGETIEAFDGLRLDF